MNNSLQTNFGEAARRDRIQNMITGYREWDDLSRSYRADGFSDLSKAVNYVTSHDVTGYTEQRLMNFYLSEILTYEGKTSLPGETQTQMIRRLVDSIASQPADIQAGHA